MLIVRVGIGDGLLVVLDVSLDAAIPVLRETGGDPGVAGV